MKFDERVQAVAKFCFTERQARFLVNVMLHSGVCLPRQYAAFAGTAYGHKTSRFFSKLVRCRYASASECLHNRARVCHVHHRPLYRAIGEPESPHRRPVAAGRVIERLMVLDAVLASPEIVWLATTEEKVANLTALTAIPPERLPRAPFCAASNRTVRLFPDKLPIGIQLEGRAVLLFAVTEASTTELRAFLQRHLALLQSLRAWTVRLLVPPHLQGMDQSLQHVVRSELATPLSSQGFDELRWYFEQRRDPASHTRLSQDDGRYARARRAFRSPRFQGLYRAWIWQGDAVLEHAKSPALATALASGAGRVECVVLPYRYRHLSPLVAGLAGRSQGVEKGDHAPTRAQPPVGALTPEAVTSAATAHATW